MGKDSERHFVGQRVDGVSFEQFYAFDSTTIRLFSPVMQGVGRNPKGDGKKKKSRREKQPLRLLLYLCSVFG
jgi:hypothetical protein